MNRKQIIYAVSITIHKTSYNGFYYSENITKNFDNELDARRYFCSQYNFYKNIYKNNVDIDLYKFNNAYFKKDRVFEMLEEKFIR